MKNLIGCLLLTLFLFSLFSTSIFASSNVSSSATVAYSIDSQSNQTVNETITIRNKSNLPAVVNSFSLYLPFAELSNLKVGTKGKNFTFSTYTKTSGKQLLILFNNKVINARASYQFDISFTTKFDLETNWGYLKLPAGFGDMNISKVTITYPIDKPKPSYISEIDSKLVSNSNTNVLTITSPENTYISILFGQTPTYKFDINKNYINYANTSEVYDLILPSSFDKQTFVLSSITPKPEYVKSDVDGNMILGFKVDAQKQASIKISGYVIKNLSIKPNNNRIVDDNIGYWTLTDSKEIARVKSYIQANNYQKNIPLGLSNYIIDNFEIEKLNTTSLENILRGGINVAINRKTSAIVEDYADCLIAYLRYYGYQARMIIGYIPESSIYSQNGFFSSWVEYFDRSSSDWVLLDPAIIDVNKMKGDISEFDRIPLIIRETNPITPKLQYFKADELTIVPTSSTVTPVFKYSISGNNVTNTGNIIIEVKTNEKNIFILPGEGTSIITSNEGIVISDQVSKNISEKVTVRGESKTINNNILSELILFTAFSTTLLLLSIIYSRIKKLWKSTRQ